MPRHHRNGSSHRRTGGLKGLPVRKKRSREKSLGINLPPSLQPEQRRRNPRTAS